MTEPLREGELSKEAMARWLDQCAIYFEKKHTNGEDMAHWSNVYNARNARLIRDYIASQPEPEGMRSERVDFIGLRTGTAYDKNHNPIYTEENKMEKSIEVLVSHRTKLVEMKAALLANKYTYAGHIQARELDKDLQSVDGLIEKAIEAGRREGK